MNLWSGSKISRVEVNKDPNNDPQEGVEGH